MFLYFSHFLTLQLNVSEAAYLGCAAMHLYLRMPLALSAGSWTHWGGGGIRVFEAWAFVEVNKVFHILWRDSSTK